MVALIAWRSRSTSPIERARWAFVVALVLLAVGRRLPDAASRSVHRRRRGVLPRARRIHRRSAHGRDRSFALLIGAVLVVVLRSSSGGGVLAAVQEKAPRLSHAGLRLRRRDLRDGRERASPRGTSRRAGAIVFMASDTLIAWNRFVQPLSLGPRGDHGHVPRRAGRARVSLSLSGASAARRNATSSSDAHLRAFVVEDRLLHRRLGEVSHRPRSRS